MPWRRPRMTHLHVLHAPFVSHILLGWKTKFFSMRSTPKRRTSTKNTHEKRKKKESKYGKSSNWTNNTNVTSTYMSTKEWTEHTKQGRKIELVFVVNIRWENLTKPDKNVTTVCKFRISQCLALIWIFFVPNWIAMTMRCIAFA